MSQDFDSNRKKLLISGNWFSKATFCHYFKVLRLAAQVPFSERSCFEVPEEFLFHSMQREASKSKSPVEDQNHIKHFFSWNKSKRWAALFLLMFSELLMVAICFFLREILILLQTSDSDSTSSEGNLQVFG